MSMMRKIENVFKAIGHQIEIALHPAKREELMFGKIIKDYGVIFKQGSASITRRTYRVFLTDGYVYENVPLVEFGKKVNKGNRLILKCTRRGVKASYDSYAHFTKSDLESLVKVLKDVTEQM